VAVDQEMKRTGRGGGARKLERGKKDEKEQKTWTPSRLYFIPLEWKGWQREGLGTK
jgi:hypothetical protein